MTGSQLLLNANRFDIRLCQIANRAARRQMLLRSMRTVSRLGDGVFWYVLMVMMPLLLGPRGVVAALHMLAIGGIGLAIYRLLKNRLVRERPFVRLAGIECFMPPLDRYSFPSGHTLHAVTFTIIACGYLPWLAIVLVPFALAVALSRVILGLHYPSDVVAGAILGAALGFGSTLIWL
jgi:undecaprenyl-diphosphatase